MAFLQGLVMLGLTVQQVFAYSSDRAGLAFSNIAFFLIWAIFLVVCAYGLLCRNSMARAPLMAAQLLHLGVAFDFAKGSDTVWIAALILASVVVVVVGVLNPASNAALSDQD